MSHRCSIGISWYVITVSQAHIYSTNCTLILYNRMKSDMKNNDKNQTDRQVNRSTCQTK